MSTFATPKLITIKVTKAKREKILKFLKKNKRTNYYTYKFEEMSEEEQTNLLYNTCPTLLECIKPHPNTRLWNFVKRKLIRKWTEQRY